MILNGLRVGNITEKSKEYYHKHKEEIKAKNRATYSYIKQPDLYKHEKWLKRKISGS